MAHPFPPWSCKNRPEMPIAVHLEKQAGISVYNPKTKRHAHTPGGRQPARKPGRSIHQRCGYRLKQWFKWCYVLLSKDMHLRSRNCALAMLSRALCSRRWSRSVGPVMTSRVAALQRVFACHGYHGRQGFIQVGCLDPCQCNSAHGHISKKGFQHLRVH